MSKQTQAPEDEFDTGIDVSTLSPEERVIYDKLNAQVRKAYLGKTSKLAEQRKAWEAEQAQIKAQHEEATQALSAWQKWYTEEGQYMTPRQQKAAMKEEGLEEPNALQEEIAGLRREFQQAAQNYNKVISELSGKLETAHGALNLQTKLFDLRFKHPEMDPMRVLDTAKERGIQDMELAYQLAYGDELRDKQVSEQVETRMKEFTEKAESEKKLVETKPSSTRYAPPAEAKNYAQAGENLIASLRGQTGGSGGTIT